jgi:hypothetical protein
MMVFRLFGGNGNFFKIDLTIVDFSITPESLLKVIIMNHVLEHLSDGLVGLKRSDINCHLGSSMRNPPWLNLKRFPAPEG